MTDLTAREQELAAIYEQVPGIVFYVRIEAGGEFRFLSMSRAGLEATGLAREQFAGALVRDVIPAASRDLVLERYREAIRSGRTMRWKEVSAYPAGQKTGEVAITPVYDADGVATHLVGVVHDVTDRERAEQTLHDHEQRLRMVLDASAAGSWTRDIGADEVDWDEGFRRLYGFSPNERGTFDAWISRVHAEDRPGVLALVDENLHPRRDSWDKTFRIARPDGTVAWIQSVGRIERDDAGGIRRLVGLEMDVTGRHEAQNREVTVLLETATQGILSVDARGTIVTANQALETMFGWPAGELIGQPLERLLPSGFRKLHEQHRAGYFTAPRPRLMGGGLHLVGERKDGSTFPIEVSLNQAGGHAFAFVTDITERQQRTLELEYRTAQLSRLASDLTLAEHHAREQIAKTLHDGLQQLLVSATLTLDRRIRRDTQQGAGADFLLEQVKAHVDQATAIARSLSYELVPPVLRHSGLPAALGWLASWARQKYGLEVIVAADPGANTPRDDVRTLLFESVRELLFNAVKHAKVGRVMVDLAIDADGMLCITVRDEGIGFDVARLAEQARARQVGWGLFSIRERVTLLGGRFEIDSAPGQGTRFQLLVPGEGATPSGGRTVPFELPADGRRHELSSGATAHADTVATVAAPALRILLVDDHAHVINALREILHEHPQLKVIGNASNGLEAISRAHALHPDVILMDVSMPIMNGVEATKRIHAELPSIQIYGLSVDARTQGPHAMELAGAAKFFMKGADMYRLVDELIVLHRMMNAEPSA